MSPLIEIRSMTSDESTAIDWKPISKQEGQFRGSQELHNLAQKIISVIEAPDSNGVAVLQYDHHSDAYNARDSIRNAVQVLSHQKVQTRKIDEIDNQGHVRGSKLYVRFRPTENK